MAKAPRIDRDQLLDALGKARSAALLRQGMETPRSGMRHATKALVEAIDAVAWLETGKQDYFAIKAHSYVRPPL